MEILWQIIIGVFSVVLIATVTVLFGIPAWAPDQRPDKQTMAIIAVITGLILCLIVGAILWESRA